MNAYDRSEARSVYGETILQKKKETIIEALNNNAEPPAELMVKLFPRLAEKFDVAKLDRAKVVTLEYAGKRSEAAILNQASPTDVGSPLQLERYSRAAVLRVKHSLTCLNSQRIVRIITGRT